MRIEPGSKNSRASRSPHGWTALGLCLVAAGCVAPPDTGTSAGPGASGATARGADNIEQVRAAALADCPEDPSNCNISGDQAVSSGTSETKLILTGAKDLLTAIGDGTSGSPGSGFKTGADLIGFISDVFFASSTPNLQGDIQCLSYEVGCIAQGLDWEIRESVWENDWNQVDQTLKNMPSGFTTGSPDDRDSGTATGNAGLPLTFSRLYLPSSTNGDGKWKDIITNSGPESMGTDDAGKAIAFDWQAGFTRFMSLIPRRLAIIAYLDPQFQADGKRTLELDGTDGYRPTLQNWLNNWMLPGVRCDTKDRILPHYNTNVSGYDYYYYDHTDIACADVNTGISEETTYVIPNYNPCIQDLCSNGITLQGGEACFGASHPFVIRLTVDSACTAGLPGQSSLPPIEDTLRREVLQQLPGFEVHSAIDELYHVVHPSPDLTGTLGRIPLAANTGLCLDVQNENPAAGTPVQLGNCNGSPGQQWLYDRKAQTIVNTAFGLCLQARPDSNGFDIGDFYPGNPVEIAECLTGGTNPPPPRQLWTFDPEKGTIRNALGTVLDVKWNNEQAGATVWLWDENDGPAQQWYADGPQAFYDGSTQCNVGGTQMHCCPTGSAMVGVRLDQNVFKCAWLRDGTGTISLDVGTQQPNTMHTCPFGSVMVGYHQDLDRLACQQIPGNPIVSDRIDSNTQDDYPLHVCETSYLNEAMSGISPDQNQITCATDPILR